MKSKLDAICIVFFAGGMLALFGGSLLFMWMEHSPEINWSAQLTMLGRGIFFFLASLTVFLVLMFASSNARNVQKSIITSRWQSSRRRR